MIWHDDTDESELTTGRRCYVPYGILGVDTVERAGSPPEIHGGYDTVIRVDTSFTAAERQEVAAHAIAAWTAWVTQEAAP